MRTLTYFITFVIVAVSAAIYTAHYALLYRVHLLGMLPGWFPTVFGHLPFPTPPDPPRYVAIASSAPLLVLALRRLFILARTGNFTPGEFRGLAYIAGIVGIVAIAVAAGVYGVTRSKFITLWVLAPASLPILFSFVLAELTGPFTKTPAAKWAGIAGGALLLGGMFLPWDRYVERWAYQRLCAGNAGEKVYTGIRADSYLLVGEARGDKGVRIKTALDDVLEGRFAFVEVQRIRQSAAQINSLNSVFNWQVPAGDFFRISIATAGSRECLPEDRQTTMDARRNRQLKEGECLAFYPIPQPSSRYRVDVQVDAQPVWYTWRVFMQQVSVADIRSGKLLGQSSLFERVGGRRDQDDLACPAPALQARRQLGGFHRKVLLGGS
jgi:hypothetical protein